VVNGSGMPNANGGDRHVQLAERKASAGMDRIGPSAVFADSLEVLEGMAGTTGLEPAASAVTGQRSNQLNYVPTRYTECQMVGSAGLEPATSCL
jgi:hypothetical protein